MKSILSCVIVDDESHARETLRAMLEEFCDHVTILGEAESAETAKQLLSTTKPDLVLLDVEMPGGSGFRLLELANDQSFHTIFTTAHEQYAMQAIKYDVTDYLLKPIEIDQLVSAVDRVRYKIKNNIEQNRKRAFELYRRFQLGNITLPMFHGYEVFPLADIIYLKADRNYSEVHLANRNRVLISKHLKELESTLPDQYFVRSHRSYLANLSHVRTMKHEVGSSLIMTDGAKIPIARRQRAIVSKALKDFNL